jgi:hypothetical protein
MSTNYVKWLFAQPENENFSFQRDTDQDGLGDNWIGDSTKCLFISEREHTHAIKLTNTIIENSFVGKSTKYRVVVNYRFLSVGAFYFTVITNNYAHNIAPVDTEWHIFEAEVTSITLETLVRIDSSACEIIIDNVAIIDSDTFGQINEIETSTHYWERNPTGANTSHGIQEETVDTVNDEVFLIHPIAYEHESNIANITFTGITREQFMYLKSLQRKDVLVRTHEDDLYACRVTNISKDFIDFQQGASQQYRVTVYLEAL